MAEQGNGQAQAPPAAGKKEAPKEDLERGLVLYKGAGGLEIKLTIGIIRAYFLGDANEQEALGFAGFCKFSQLNPFMREAYLIRRNEGDKASIVVAYNAFMKRAERAGKKYGGFKAGLVLAPPPLEVDKATGEVTIPPALIGEAVDGVYSPFVAIQGALTPPGYTIVGGWCKVIRTDRPEPIVSVVPLAEYEGHRRDGAVTKIWSEKRGTMIRKVPIGQAHRDAFPDELAGFYLEEEIANVALPREAVRVKDEPPAPDLAIPEACKPLLLELVWNVGTIEMFFGRHAKKSEAELVALLEREVVAERKRVGPAKTELLLGPLGGEQRPREAVGREAPEPPDPRQMTLG